MKKTKHYILKTSYEKEAYIWNILAGIINASEAVILMLVVTRITGVEDAGIISISMAVANILMTIGKFGVRNLQVTDVEKEISFSTYFCNRIITVLIMLGGSIGYAWSGILKRGYSQEKAVVMVLICGLYMIEAFEDVFGGLYQQKGRLDISAKIFSIRWFCTLLTYVFALLIYKNLLKATIVAFGVNTLVMILLLRISYPSFREADGNTDVIKQKELFARAFPLAVSAYLSFYVVNASKYAIDATLSDAEQACYGFVSMPVFVIGLLNSFIYQPTLVKTALEWEGRKIKILEKRIKKQLCYIVGITVTCVALAYLCGIPFLSILYQTDLSDYKQHLIILLFAGGGLAISGYLNVLLTIMKKQKIMMMEYCLVGGIAWSCSSIFVRQYGTMGAVAFYLILSFAVAVLLGASVIYYLTKARQ